MTYSSVRDRLEAVRSALTEHPNDTQEFTVREFVGWFGYQRRTRSHVREMRKALRRAGLRTVPDFNEAHIDSMMAFELREAAEADPPVPTKRTGPEPGSSSRPQRTTPQKDETEPEDEAEVDPPARVSRLPSANRPVVSVKPDDTLATATTEMLKHGYSQLPVMVNERQVKGMVSWESIGKHLSLGLEVNYIRDCMVEPEEVSADSLLFDAVDTVIASKAVVVRGEGNRIVGILTTGDLSREFHRLGEPFLRIGEIENHLRDLLRALPSEKIVGAADPSGSREIESASDLTFGEVLRLIEQPDIWEQVGLPLDRASLLRDLEQVRTIRNDVMHFDPEGLDDADLALLRRIASLFQELRTMGIPAAFGRLRGQS